MTNAVQRTADAPGPFAPSSHAVQFYETDDYLVGAGATFLAAGISEGRACVVVATEAHRRELANELRRHGLDVTLLDREYQLVMIDAAQTLATFMIGGMPDELLVRAATEPVLRRAALHSQGGRPLVFGEMVDLLWRGGDKAAALSLESIWNDLARRQEMDVLCSYRLDGFANAADATGFSEVCREHSVVVPTERFTEVGDEERLTAISMLQQRAKALETEVAKSTRLELRLRLALERERSIRDALARSERSEHDLLSLIASLLGSGDAGGDHEAPSR